MFGFDGAFDFLCPYCMKRYAKSEILSVCNECGQSGVYGKDCTQTPGCNGRAIVKICPKCHHEIKKDLIDCKNIPFSIIGVTKSGKTNFITVMMHELENNDLGIILSSDESSRGIQNKNWKRLNEEHKIIKVTPPGNKPEPQIWLVQNGRKFSNFTIYDGAGEDQLRHDPTINRYIGTSKAIFLLLDPLSLEHLKDYGKDNKAFENSNTSGENQQEIIDNTITFLQESLMLNAKKKIDIPTAVILTKFDLFLDGVTVHPNSIILRENSIFETGKYDKSETDAVSREIEEWLIKNSEKPFVEKIKGKFKNYKFFAISSFGSAPDENETINEIKPHRILDPIIWLLNSSNVL